jgi:hypothetical protein
VPIQGFKVTGSDGPVLVFYAVEVDELVLAGSRKLETKIRPILDSGTLLNLVPTDVAKQYNELWTPPAQYDADKGVYVVRGFFAECDGGANSLRRCRATRLRLRSRL